MAGKKKSKGGRSPFVARARAAVSRGRTKAKGFLDGVKPVEALLFGAGGYFLGPVLNATGLPGWLYARSGAYRQLVDASYAVSPSTGEAGGGRLITKLAGAGILAYDVGKAATGKAITTGDKNVLLPFAIGAMADPDTAAGPGGGDYW